MSVWKKLITAFALAFLAGVCWTVYLYESGEVTPDRLKDGEDGDSDE